MRKHFPNLTALVRARNNLETIELMELGASRIYRESLDASGWLGVDVLAQPGFRHYTAQRAG